MANIELHCHRGNILVIGSSSAVVLGLTWGGITAPWSSYRVLVPLILGLLGFFVFITFEALWAVEPIVRLRLLLLWH